MATLRGASNATPLSVYPDIFSRPRQRTLGGLEVKVQSCGGNRDNSQMWSNLFAEYDISPTALVRSH